MRLVVVAIASSWFCINMFDKIYDVVIFVWITPTMDELDKASSFISSGWIYLDSDISFGTSVEFSNKTSPFLSSGQIFLDLGRYFGLVTICDFIFLLIFSGLGISHSSSRFFCFFYLSIFWIWVGYLILFILYLSHLRFGRLVASDSNSDRMDQHPPPSPTWLILGQWWGSFLDELPPLLILNDFFPPFYAFSVIVEPWLYKWWLRFNDVGYSFVD